MGGSGARPVPARVRETPARIPSIEEPAHDLPRARHARGHSATGSLIDFRRNRVDRRPPGRALRAESLAMNRTNQNLTFHKKEFRVLDPRELARIKGGNGEGEEMDLPGEREPNT
jgi:hypothetical protein